MISLLLCSPLHNVKVLLTRAHKFREAGLDPALNRVQAHRTLPARWRNRKTKSCSGNAKAGVVLLGLQIRARSGAAGAPKHSRRVREQRELGDSAESSLPAGTGSESDFHVSPRNVAPSSSLSPRKEQNNDSCDLLIFKSSRHVVSTNWSVRSTCSRPCCVRQAA